MNRVANLSAAEIPVRATTTRQRARTRASYPIADGVILIVILTAAAICYSYYHQMSARLDSALAEHARVEAQVSALEIENQRIAAEIQALTIDPERVEQAAREQLGMVRPGEVVLSLTPKSNADR